MRIFRRRLHDRVLGSASGGLLRRPLLFLVMLLLLALVAGAVAIGTIGAPAPTKRIEKPIANDRLPR
jgi:hypothetical protein